MVLTDGLPVELTVAVTVVLRSRGTLRVRRIAVPLVCPAAIVKSTLVVPVGRRKSDELEKVILPVVVTDGARFRVTSTVTVPPCRTLLPGTSLMD